MSFLRNFIRHLDQLTNGDLSSLARTQTRHQVSTPSPFTALAPPPSPSRPGPSILTDGRSKGSLTVVKYARGWTSEVIYRRMSFVLYHATTAE